MTLYASLPHPFPQRTELIKLMGSCAINVDVTIIVVVVLVIIIVVVIITVVVVVVIIVITIIYQRIHQANDN